MSKNALAILSVVLALVCAGESVVLYRQHQARKRMLNPWADLDRWMSEADKNIYAGDPVPLKDFDRLFDDRFFHNRFDPFREIEEFSRQFDSMIQPQNRPRFNQSWQDWFHDRLDLTDLHQEIKTTPEHVILTLKIPRLDNPSLQVNVDKDRIKIHYSARTVQEEKDKKGNVLRKSESEQQFEKILPVPAEADPGTAVVKQSPDQVEITFKKRAGVKKE